jgi:cytochrome subunit of sulfide dehydrogenase
MPQFIELSMQGNRMRSLLRRNLSLVSGVFTCALLAMSNASLHAQEATLNTKQLASNCANCHGTNGNAVAGTPVPGLAGYNRDAFIAAMAAFKKGEKQATIMHQISKGYSDEQIAALASYFAVQKKN